MRFAFDWLFRKMPAERLAVLRYATGAFGLYYILSRTDRLIRINKTDPTMFAPTGVANVLNEPLSQPVYECMLWTLLALNILYIVGFKFRWVGPLFATLTFFFLSYRNSWSMIYHIENAYVLQAFVVGLSRAGDAWSLDALFKNHGSNQKRESGYYGWPVQTVILLTTTTYFLSGYAKVAGELGFGWMKGDLMRSQMITDAIRKSVFQVEPTPMFELVYNWTWLFTIMGVFTLIVELGAPLALWNRAVGRVWALATFVMHWGIFILMSIKFEFQIAFLVFLAFFDVERLFNLRSAATTSEAPNEPILMFDGECVLCNRSVQWVAKREKDNRLQFASLSSKKAKEILLPIGLEGYADSIVYVDEQGQVYLAHDAAFKLLVHLKWYWKLLHVLQIAPRGLRSAVYNWVAERRIGWFGAVDNCALLHDFDQERLHQE